VQNSVALLHHTRLNSLQKNLSISPPWCQCCCQGVSRTRTRTWCPTPRTSTWK